MYNTITITNTIKCFCGGEPVKILGGRVKIWTTSDLLSHTILGQLQILLGYVWCMHSIQSKCVWACSLSTSANATYQMSGHVLVMDASGGKMKHNVSGRTLPGYT